jgi:hypothetical protein
MCIVVVGGVVIGAGTELAIQAASNWWNGRDVLDRNCYDLGEVAIAGGLGGVGGRAHLADVWPILSINLGT